MPIGFRPTQPYTLPNAPITGQVVSLPFIDGIQDSMRHLAERGAWSHVECGRSINGLNLPVIGFKGGASGFVHGKQSVCWILPYHSGFDTMTIFSYYRLNKTFQNENLGSNFTVSLVLNGAKQEVFRRGWRDTLPNALGEGYYQANTTITDLFRMPIEEPTTLVLLVEYDTCDGDTSKFGQQSYSGGFTTQTFYNGIRYLGFSLWKNCETC